LPCCGGPANLLGRQLQHGFGAGAADPVDELIDGHAAVLDQFHLGSSAWPLRTGNSVSLRSPAFPWLSIVW